MKSPAYLRAKYRPQCGRLPFETRLCVVWGFVSGRWPQATTSRYLALKSNGYHHPKISLKNSNFHLKPFSQMSSKSCRICISQTALRGMRKQPKRWEAYCRDDVQIIRRKRTAGVQSAAKLFRQFLRSLKEPYFSIHVTRCAAGLRSAV